MAKSIPELTPENPVEAVADVAVELVEEAQEIFSDPAIEQTVVEQVVEIQAEPEVVVDPAPQVEVPTPMPVSNPQRTRVSEGGIVAARSNRKP